MIVYPYTSPIILTDDIFVEYGGKTGTFTASQRRASYLTAEIQVTNYIDTFLLPTVVTGTYPYVGRYRTPTDYGYVSQMFNITVWSKGQLVNSCNLVENPACGYIYEDTFGYIDWRQLSIVCGMSWYWGYQGPVIVPSTPYKIQIAYEAGLPTGTASQPPILQALTILAQIDLNEKDPGNAGMNETTGDVGVQDWKSLDYKETRAEHALVKTALGDSAKAQRAKKLIDATIKKARKVLFA